MKRQHESTSSPNSGQMTSKARSRKQVENSTFQSVRVKCNHASEVFKDLYLDDRTADVFFICKGSTERVPAHKAILSFGSSIFKKTFFGPSAVSDDIWFAGHSLDAFKDFLQFFYLNEIMLKTITIREVFFLTMLYDLPYKCLELCGRFCTDHYDYRNIDNICFVYSLAIVFQNKKSQTICERQIATHCEKVLKTHDFLSCPFGVIDLILDLDTLLCDESVVMSACLAWARNTCKQNGKDEFVVANWRECLIDDSNGTNLLHKIRYSSIARDEFSIFLDVLDTLFPDASEREDLMLLLLGSTNLKTGKFSMKPRNELKWNDDHAMDCMFEEKDIHSKLLVKKQFHHVLNTTQAILLGGFYIVPLVSKAPDVAFICVNVTIVEQQNDGDTDGDAVSKLIHKESQKVPERMGNYYMQFKPKPIIIRPDREYHIGIYCGCPIYDHLNDNAEFCLKYSSAYDSEDGPSHSWDNGTDHELNRTNALDDHTYSISFCDEVEYNQKIKINDDLSIQCYLKRSNGSYNNLLINGFKFVQL